MDGIMSQQISIGELATHAGTIGAILFFVLKNYNKWHKIQDRLDALYQDYCDKHEIEFTSVKDE